MACVLRGSLRRYRQAVARRRPRAPDRGPESSDRLYLWLGADYYFLTSSLTRNKCDAQRRPDREDALLE